MYNSVLSTQEKKKTTKISLNTGLNIFYVELIISWRLNSGSVNVTTHPVTLVLGPSNSFAAPLHARTYHYIDLVRTSFSPAESV